MKQEIIVSRAGKHYRIEIYLVKNINALFGKYYWSYFGESSSHFYASDDELNVDMTNEIFFADFAKWIGFTYVGKVGG